MESEDFVQECHEIILSLNGVDVDKKLEIITKYLLEFAKEIKELRSSKAILQEEHNKCDAVEGQLKHNLWGLESQLKHQAINLREFKEKCKALEKKLKECHCSEMSCLRALKAERDAALKKDLEQRACREKEVREANLCEVFSAFTQKALQIAMDQYHPTPHVSVVVSSVTAEEGVDEDLVELKKQQE